MLIRCSDNCRFQEDGFCGLKNIYAATVTSSAGEINDSGCIYYKPRTPKNQRRQAPENQKNAERSKQSGQERRKYF